MRVKSLVMLAVAVVIVGGCKGRERSITGGYGNGVVSGQVFLAAGMPDRSPEGIDVGVAGMMMRLGADGRFTFIDVPEGAEMRFTRAADALDLRMIVPGGGQPLSIELSASGAKASGRRRPVTGPLSQYEGLVVEATPGSLTMTDSHGDVVSFLLTAATVIRHGGTPLTAEDLDPGDRVHVKAQVRDDVRTAVEVHLQNPADDDDEDGGENPLPAGQNMTANGQIVAAGNSGITVRTVPRGDVVVRIDARTVIRRQGQRIGAADLRTGWEVNARGIRIDDHTLRAEQIEVRGNSGRR